jgi:hypothetical protein
MLRGSYRARTFGDHDDNYGDDVDFPGNVQVDSIFQRPSRGDADGYSISRGLGSMPNRDRGFSILSDFSGFLGLSGNASFPMPPYVGIEPDGRRRARFADYGVRMGSGRRGLQGASVSDRRSPEAHIISEEMNPRISSDRERRFLSRGNHVRVPYRIYGDEDWDQEASPDSYRRTRVPRMDPISPRSNTLDHLDNSNFRRQHQRARHSPNRAFTSWVVNEDEDSGRRYNFGYKDNALPFGRAMIQLHRVLDAAEKFYTEFQNDYDNDVKALKSYGSDDLLDSAWIMKVKGQGSRGDFEEDEDEIDDATESYTETFKENMKKVVDAMEAATKSRLIWGTIESTDQIIESRKRLQEKVTTSSKHIRDLMKVAMKTRKNCEAFLEELSLLKDLVEPESRKNKILYRNGNGEDIDAAQDNAKSPGEVGNGNQGNEDNDW